MSSIINCVLKNVRKEKNRHAAQAFNPRLLPEDARQIIPQLNENQRIQLSQIMETQCAEAFEEGQPVATAGELFKAHQLEMKPNAIKGKERRWLSWGRQGSRVPAHDRNSGETFKQIEPHVHLNTRKGRGDHFATTRKKG